MTVATTTTPPRISGRAIKPLGVYKFSWPWQLFGTAVGFLLGTGSLYFLLTSVRGRFIPVPGIFMGIWMIIAGFRSKLVLYPDIVEVYGAFFMRSIRRDQIISKTYAGLNGIFLWRDKRWQWPFQVATQLNADQKFWDWINSIPTGYPSTVRQGKNINEAAHNQFVRRVLLIWCSLGIVACCLLVLILGPHVLHR